MSGHRVIELFDYFPGNHDLTEEAIYGQQPTSEDNAIPIYSGSQENERPMAHIREGGKNQEGGDLVYFHGPCLILTKDGSAGLLTYRGHGEYFTINHHACVLKVKREWQDRLDAQWFAYQYQSHLFRVVTSKSDNRVFSTEWFDRLEFGIPSSDIQKRQRKMRNALQQLKSALQQASRQATDLLNQQISLSGVATTVAKISDVFEIYGGNSGLTEEVIYNYQPLTEVDALEILTGATLEQNRMGYISPQAALGNGRALKTFNDECILITRKGYYAGTMIYVGKKRFVTNDDADVLIPKADWKEKINLKWFVHQYQGNLSQIITSKSDNATFNTDWLEKMSMRIPERPLQDAIAKKITVVQDLMAQLQLIERQADELSYCSLL